jgi:dynein assembly factor 1
MAVGAVDSEAAHAANGMTLQKDAANEKEESHVSVDEGIPRMTPQTLKECCTKNQGWSAPDLNDSLVLHYKGFRKIENLEPYVNAKTIWLECNGISCIEGLSHLSGLLLLYLQSNCITHISNLHALTSLQYLNLAHNSIQKVEGLEELRSLETINLSANKITDVAGLEGLLERQSLRSVDISQNYIEDGDAYLNFWDKAIPDVQCLYLHHNPCSRALKDYRRRLVSSLKQLRWIDDRPVSELERVGSEAWADGGKDAEVEAKRNFVLQEKEAKEKSFKTFQRMSQAAAARIKAQKEAQAAREDAQQEVATELEQSGELAAGWVASSAKSSARIAEAFEEPAQQSELCAKVQAFLGSRAHSSDTEASTETSVQAAEDEAGATEGEAAADEEDGSMVEQEDLLKEPEEFTWTDFREKRLGRITAECRYNFQKVAVQLSEEFACAIDTEACRQRYGELIKPRGRVNLEADAGRARDAPDVDPNTVQEVSKWWVRQVSLQKSLSRAQTSVTETSQTPPSSSDLVNASEVCELNKHLEEAYARSAGSAATARDASSTASTLGGLLGDMQRYEEFAPPSRVPTRVTIEDVSPEVIEVRPPSQVPAGSSGVKVSAQSELYDLD